MKSEHDIPPISMPAISYPILAQCKVGPHRVVLFSGPKKGTVVYGHDLGDQGHEWVAVTDASVWRILEPREKITLTNQDQ